MREVYKYGNDDDEDFSYTLSLSPSLSLPFFISFPPPWQVISVNCRVSRVITDVREILLG